MKQISSDSKTRKYAVPVRKGLVETTYVDYPNKHIICFSSMMGCPIGCKFCSSGYRKLVTPLTDVEMVEECTYVINQEQIKNDKVILFSCMGEGEPLLNYKNVVSALRILTWRYPNSKIAISTSGIKPQVIERLAAEEFSVPVKLQVSIHHTIDRLRREMIPVTAGLHDIKAALDIFRTTDKGLELNYVLFESLNDGRQDAERLASFADGICIKLNRFNTIPESRYKPSGNLKAFTDTLDACGATYEVYETNGTDIGAACGQLTYKGLDTGIR